jgi:uncharacterized protein YndB with AHSA1/START domain
MIIDVAHQISAVRREVGGRVLEAGTARVMTVSRTYDATVEEVWDACTDAERMARWFTPVSGDLRLGGRYQLAGNASGTIERCEPPHLVGATWEYGGEVSWIELRLGAETDATTRLTLEHVAHVDDERWLEYGPGATGVGWDLAFLGLGLHLADPSATLDPAWATSANAREFMVESSRRWERAAVAAGDDPEQARAAAERTASFYSGAEG